jgi:hypothetical protein
MSEVNFVLRINFPAHLQAVKIASKSQDKITTEDGHQLRKVDMTHLVFDSFESAKQELIRHQEAIVADLQEHLTNHTQLLETAKKLEEETLLKKDILDIKDLTPDSRGV